ncbi:hypothetical protein TeGR_g10947 [Tetraparma gracilis]|uniref:Aspartyl/asparaginy/proline hydroxylase domain-containing protein n=1 Tax=Tetraparma gracilis TaxID=2962635 RepID=A0ABQ6M9Y6_9STRA|nr:hypothetical protein TeGR_g10947 [Tetraparma gracilis]
MPASRIQIAGCCVLAAAVAYTTVSMSNLPFVTPDSDGAVYDSEGLLDNPEKWRSGALGDASHASKLFSSGKEWVKNVVGVDSNADWHTPPSSWLPGKLNPHPGIDGEHESEDFHYLDLNMKRLEKFKPGVRSMIFIFCDQKGNKVFEFPWFEEYKPVLDPIVNHILDLYGLDLSYVNRLQLALMTPYAEIKQHVDKGDWVAMSHRIHVVVTVNPEVKFNVWADDDWGEVRIAKGDVWEINNLFRHKVSNEGPNERIHLIMDLGEVPHTGEDWVKLEKGDACDYKESLRSGRLACVSSLEEGWEQRL